jgi:type II secretion system protein H
MPKSERNPNAEIRTPPGAAVRALPELGFGHSFVIRLPRRSQTKVGHWSFVIGRGSAGFTLIELILVMTVLTIAVSITVPALGNFFRARSLDSEARRLLALTRQGQSRAVSEGVPMELWVDAAQGAYGLEAEPSYEPSDSKAVTLSLDQNLRLELASANAANGAIASVTQPASGSGRPGPAVVSQHPNLPKIVFLPDGYVSETSPQSVRLVSRDGGAIALVQSANRLNYELRTASYQ